MLIFKDNLFPYWTSSIVPPPPTSSGPFGCGLHASFCGVINLEAHHLCGAFSANPSV